MYLTSGKIEILLVLNVSSIEGKVKFKSKYF